MKNLAVSAFAFTLCLCVSGIAIAESLGTSAVSRATSQEADDDPGLSLFYRPGPSKAPINVSVDGSLVARVTPGETIKLLPSPGPLTVGLTASSLPGPSSVRNLDWQTEIEEGQSKSVIMQLTGTGIRLVEQQRAMQARSHDKVFAFDGEDGSWVDVSPPPPNALRRNDSLSQDGIHWKSPKSWPVRVIFVSGHGLYEFDTKGNVLRIDGQQPSMPVSIRQEQHGNKPTWSNGVVYQLVRGDAPIDDKVESARTFVLTKRGSVCPAKSIAEAYRLRREISSSIFSGDCDRAVRWQRTGVSLLAYESDVNTGEPPELLWAVQYFRDPVRPLLDSDGKCVYACTPIN